MFGFEKFRAKESGQPSAQEIEKVMSPPFEMIKANLSEDLYHEYVAGQERAEQIAVSNDPEQQKEREVLFARLAELEKMALDANSKKEQ